MKSVQVAARVNEAGRLELVEPLPEEFRSTEVRVLVLDAAEAEEEAGARAWRDLALAEFFKGYDDADSIYDDMK